ncbi:hypothetical protein ACJJTC_013672 [Scirpophaga incertulas]
MSVILRGAVRLYYYLNEEIADPRTQEWYLMRTPWPGLCLMGLYLLVVFRWLPKHMSNRPAYDLRPIIAAYNIVQIIGCSYVVYKSLVLGWLNHYSMVCQPVGQGPHGVSYAWHVCYMYFLIKVVDLLDTVNFFRLRKKQDQITFLHVYHHFGMVAVAWGIVKWVTRTLTRPEFIMCKIPTYLIPPASTGGHCTFLVTANSFVHIIMYMYYLLTIWDKSYKRSVWWKRHVTEIQIAQFSILFIHFLVLVMARDCGFPRQPAYILIPQNIFMVILFSDFYYRTYIKKSNKN